MYSLPRLREVVHLELCWAVPLRRLDLGLSYSSPHSSGTRISFLRKGLYVRRLMNTVLEIDITVRLSYGTLVIGRSAHCL